MTKLSSSYEIVIRPRQPWLHFDWQGLVQYRDLFWEMVRRDFSARYKQTILGPIWFIINPLITTFIMVLVFSKGLGVSTNGIPAPLFFLGGQLAWNYFGQVLGSTANTLAGNAHLFGKVYFPRLIVPLVAVASNLISFVLQLGLLAVVYVWILVMHPDEMSRPTIWLLALPALVFQCALLSLGTGLILSCISAKYKDFTHLTSFLMQIWMYLSPILWSLSQIQDKWPKWSWVVVANPLTAIIEGMRAMLFGVHGRPTLTVEQYALSAAVSFVLFIVGVLMFQRTARTFIDYV